MRAIRLDERSIPLLFLIVTVVAYGLLLPLTGFYWDDWPFAWTAKFLGPQEFIPAFAGVRPFLGPIFFVTTTLIPPVPLYWQIFALIIRFLSGLSAWFMLSQIWPHRKQRVLMASLVFLVFPGYSQHWVAFTHINQEWIPFIFYLLSFGFTARALRNHRENVGPFAWKGGRAETQNRSAGQENGSGAGGLLRHHVPRNDTIYALLLLIAGVFPTEYFVTLEPLRFLFIWAILSENALSLPQKFRQALRHWWPYLLIWLGNAAWLAYFYTFGIYGSYEVEVVQDPLKITQIFPALGDALWKVGFYVWVQVLGLISGTLTAPTSLFTLVLVCVTFIFFVLYFTKIDHSHAEAPTFAIQAILIGLAGILLGRIPSLAAGLPLTLQSSYDRFMISMMLGGSLFVAGMVDWLIRNARVKSYAFALLVALGIGQQFFNANIFRRDWTKQQEIYWQLAWRIPDMKPATALLTDQLPIDYETDLSFTAPINWMYAPDYKRSTPGSGSVDQRSDLPYALIYTEKRLGRGALPSLEPGRPIHLDFRRVAFQGSTSQAITIYMPKNGCLRVLDPARGDEITYGRQSRFLVNAIPRSDPARILAEANQTVKLPFLSEPEHTWCYYFAKAELAYQQGDWHEIMDLMEQAISLGYEPEDPFEWLTYIEAQAVTGDIEAARQRSIDLLARDKRIRPGLCQLWKRVQEQSTARNEMMSRITKLYSEFQCAR